VISNRDFLAYRARLLMAVERRDVDGVVQAMDPDIKLDFGGGGGVAAFRKRLADAPELWDELRVVLARGGRFSSATSFAAPYVYSNWPERFDSFECAAATGRSVRLRSAPQLDAPIVAAVSYSIVRLIEPAQTARSGRASSLAMAVPATCGTPTCAARSTTARSSI
jgi:hypothetical protein